MQWWVGHSQSDLTAKWGPPHYTTYDSDGGTVLIYEFFDGAGPSINLTDSGSTLTSTSGSLASRMRMFFLNPRGVIYKVSWNGLDPPVKLTPTPRASVNLDAQFGRFVRDISVRPWHNAVAVAKDATKWAWGGAFSEPDADAARKAALLNCLSDRARQLVDAPCRVYSTDGQVTE
jgi:hypothetical protein